MGLTERVFHRRDKTVIAESAGFQDDQLPNYDSQLSDSDTLSLEARNEKEVQAHPDQVTADAQLGVQKAEAAALVWSKKAVYASYAWIWLCFFMLALQSSIMNQAIQAGLSQFNFSPSYNTGLILANVIGGVLKLPIAKTLNIWGRAEGYTVFVSVYVLGMIVLASATGPSSYAAGYVLYWIGYDAVYVILDIFIADTSGLRNRAFTWAFASTPFICTSFTGPLAAASFLRTTTWQWAIGAFIIIQPVVFLPLALVFKFYQRKAEKMGLFKKEKSNRTVMQSIVHYSHEFDIVGALILMTAFVLVLLPFGLESYGRIAYDSGAFIAMIVVGAFLFPVFYAWERYFARVQFLNWQLLRERTVLGACVCAATLFFGFYCWNSLYYNFVIVVYDLNFRDTGYMYSIYDVGSTFWGVIFGLWIRYTKHFKWTTLLFGAAMSIFGSGLMIYFRGDDKGIGYIIMCQIFIAFGGGTIVIGQQMAVMAAADREGVPMMLALIFLSTDIGGAIGSAVAAAVYSNTFVSALTQQLPAGQKSMATKLYLGGYELQRTYEVGSAVRDAVNYAYGRTQFYQCIAATSALTLLIPAISAWKNYNVDKKQNKGTVI